MKAAFCIVSITLLALPGAPRAATLRGVEFPERMEAGTTTLHLRGAAVLRYRVIFDAYAAALYLGEGVAAEAVLDDVPRRLEIEYFWSIPADGFARATVEGIERNVTPDTLESLRPRIERFNALYRDVEPGDRYALTYVPGQGTVLSHNGRERGRIEGADFARALFAIWLGEVPFDATLKSRLLEASS